MSRPLQAAFFNVDVTPPMGSPLCHNGVEPAKAVDDPLTCRGVVLLVDPEPIVLCTVDWVGIGNGAYRLWQEQLAAAAGTSPDRVCLHVVHQHDAPGHDETAQSLLDGVGLPDTLQPSAFCRQAVERAAEAIRTAVQHPRPVTHMGVGQGEVCQVASNRRIIGPDGQAKTMRASRCQDPELRAAPEGLIDPLVRAVVLFEQDQPLACLTWYATHPQSHYGKGRISWDFPGIARVVREQALPGVKHIHFNGASGNVAAGKYNDGSPENRPVLAQRLADGMAAAWDDAVASRESVDAGSLDFRVLSVHLPVWEEFDEQALQATLEDASRPLRDRIRAARHLAWMRRDWPINLTRLQIGRTCLVGLPAESFIEFQLLAQRLRPNDVVCVAAYADYAAGYICTSIAHEQGGYEPTASRTGPAGEPALTRAIEQLLAD